MHLLPKGLCAISAALLALSTILFITVSEANQPASDNPFGEFGLDLTAQDQSIKPGDDFYLYANGHWLDTAKRPPDRTRWGNVDLLAEATDEQVHRVIENLPPNAAAGSIEQKVGDYYRAFLDVAAIETAGLRPARTSLDAIDAARTHVAIATLMGRPDLHLYSPFMVGFVVDEKAPDRYLVEIGQSGLGLPDRDYYLNTDAKFVAIREQYRVHLENMLKLGGEADGARKAQQIIDLETAIANLHWPRDKLRQRELIYNPRSLAQMKQLAPHFPWEAMLVPMGLGSHQRFNIAEIDTVGPLGDLFTDTSVSVWQSYLKVHFLDGFADVLPPRFDDEHFDFYGRKLNGQREQRERWKRAVSSVSHTVGEAVGQLYVKQNFPPSAKAQVLDLVERLRQAYIERLKTTAWMSAQTRRVAVEKAVMFRLKIAYPDKWRDYSSLVIRPNDAFGNQARAQNFEWRRQLNRLDRPTDRDEWEVSPQTVNAYYSAPFNEVVFPAAILQSPFFDPNADPAVNYGGIGAIIGHEMGHAFDDQGAKSDGAGVLRTWWLPEDTVAFKKLGDELAAQYDAFEPVPGMHINGRATLGENIGDLAGLSIAYIAYHSSLEGRMAPVLKGLTGDQRFFLAWAQVWRTLTSDEAARNQVMTDFHSPRKFRVNGVVRNVDAWYAAFGIGPGDKLYLAPSQRVHIW
jgi:putative endopeptidase